ncbi:MULTISPECIES: DNA polymerase III subunit gamma/tau [Methylotenera]|uniref:DNA polymerase III subunit gamma/tau n=1 Tax=Methylotenera TaxID=359407 RepID=UPI0003688FA3|nr:MULTISPECIES: DNA polymerase III subunit gamma/tau [Methylotenera]
MSYIVLARKYRPKSFDTLVGQPHVVRALTNALTQQRLHHAYLFTGTRGVGKTTIARILAKSLNCETGITATPCGVCNACTEIDRGRFVDLLEVDAASNTQVDAMRELLDNAQYAPTVGRFKVYIIDEVHMLSKSAFNAMLKTLEEPPSHVKFILATTDPQKVPVTVLSRCLQFNLRQMASITITEHLQNVLAQESISYEPTAINLIARAAAGSMRDALSLTDQAIAYGNQTVNEAEVRSMLGAIDQTYLFDILYALINQDGAGLIEKALSMQMRNIAFEAALNDLANILHQIAVIQTVPNSIAGDHPEHALLSDLATKLPAETLQLYYQIALLGRRDIGLAPDEYAGFTMSLLRMLAFSPHEKLTANQPKSAVSTQQLASKPTISTAPNPVEKQPDLQRSDSQMNASRIAEPPLQTNAIISIENSTSEQRNNDSDTENIENTSAANSNFDGNWRRLVEQNLKLGLARALAQNCEMVNYDENSITLRVAENQKHLISASYQDKLSSAINQHFGKKIKLTVEVGSEHEAEIITPAKQNAAEKATVQGAAEAAIMQDSFVQALMTDFGATIIPNSIKPI